MKLYTVRAIASVLDLSEKRVRQLKEAGTITETKPGLFELKPTIHQYIRYLRSLSADRNLASDYNTERARLVKVKADSEELTFKHRIGELHKAADIELVMKTMLINFKGRLHAIPAKHSPALAEMKSVNDVHDLLRKSVDEALEELSDFQTFFASIGDSDGTEDD